MVALHLIFQDRIINLASFTTARSPDPIITCDYYLWGCLRQNVYGKINTHRRRSHGIIWHVESKISIPDHQVSNTVESCYKLFLKHALTCGVVLCERHFFSPLQARQLFLTESLHSLGHPVTAAMLRSTIKDTRYNTKS
jgi:hypothetical protein